MDVKERRAQLSAGSRIDAAIDDPAYSRIPAYIRDFERPAPAVRRRLQPALPIDRAAGSDKIARRLAVEEGDGLAPNALVS